MGKRKLIKKMDRKIIFKEVFLSLIVFFVSLGYFLKFYNKGVDFIDEGAILYIADRVSRGELLYTETWTAWTPGVFYLLSFSFKALGTSMLTGRIVTALFGALTSVVIYRLASLLVSRPLSLLPSALFVVWGLPFHFEPYHSWFALFFSLCSVLGACYYVESKDAKFLFIAGILSGITAFFKINFGGLTFLSIAAYILLAEFLARRDGEGRNPIEQLKDLALLSAGALLVLGSLSLFFYTKGNFGEMVHSVLLFPIEETRKFAYIIPGPMDALREFLEAKPYSLMLYLPIPIYLGTLLFSSKENAVQKNRQLLLQLYALFFFFTAYPQFNWVHLIQALVPVYLLLALLIDGALRRAKTTERQGAGVYTIVFLFLAFSTTILLTGAIINRGYFLRDSNYTIELDIPRGGVYISQAEMGNEHITEITDFVKKADGEVFIVPHQPLFYFLSDRKSPSRFFASDYLTSKAMEMEQISILERDRVPYIVFFYGSARTDWGTGKSYFDLTDLRSYVYTHYAIVDYYSTFVKETELDAMNILVLKRIEADPQNYVKLSLPTPDGKDFYLTTKEVIKRVISAGLTEERALRPDDKQR